MTDSIHALKKELQSLKIDFHSRCTRIETIIRSLEAEKRGESESRSDRPLKTTLIPEKSREVSPSAQMKTVQAPESSAVKTDILVRKKAVEKTAETQLRRSFISVAAENILPVVGPFAAVFSGIASLYKRYRDQGKVPVFFMTIAGILTLVMGMGYLLQYSFSRFLGPQGKVAAGFLAAAGIILTGTRIYRKKEGMGEYASGLIGLGVILFYLCAYFTASFYGLISHLPAFVLLGAITGGAYFLALAFKTRIVAMISLLGGVFAPLLMAGAGQSPLVYLGYVFVLVAAMLHLSRRIDWPFLSHSGMAAAFVVIDFILGLFARAPMEVLLFIHMFFYLFWMSNGVEIFKQKRLTRAVILSISSNIFFFLFALNKAISHHHSLGIIFLVNALVLGMVFFILPLAASASDEGARRALRGGQTLSLMAAGLLAGFGILALTGPEFLGLVWGLEAVFLLAMGLWYKILPVRMEAFGGLCLSLILAAWQAGAWVLGAVAPLPDIFRLDFGYGWMNLVLTVVLLWPCLLLMERFSENLIPLEKQWLKMGNEALSVCLSFSFLFTVGVFWSPGLWLLSPVPMFYMIYRSRAKDLVFTEYWGLSHFLLLLVPMLTSAGIAGNFFFTEQIPIGKIARIEAFFCLFLISEFYRRYHHGRSRLFPFALNLRILFFCIIPVFFLAGVWHQYIAFFPLAVWASAGICLALFWKFRYPALLMELKILVIGASIVSIGACALVKFSGWEGYGMPALVTGLVFYILVLKIWKGLEDVSLASEDFLVLREKLSLIFTLFFYYSGLFIFIFLYGLLGSAALAFTLMTGYFTLVFVKLPLLAPLEKNGIFIYGIVFISAAAMVLAYLLSCARGMDFSGFFGPVFGYGIFNIMTLFFIGLLVHLVRPHFEAVRNRFGRTRVHLWGFHSLAGLTYAGVLSQWFDAGFGPALSVALVVHATLVLFLTLKPRFENLISLAVLLFAGAACKILFWDMTDFSLVQKVIAFILIGVLLLGAAYYYQKLRSSGPGIDNRE